jgi:hypothetical protein
MPKKTFILSAILLLFALLYAMPVASEQTTHVTKVSAEVNPSEHAGPCPKTFHFAGVITVSRAGKVKYQWERSDGKHRPPAFTGFSGPDAHTVREVWTLGSSSAPFHYNGYMRLRILSPYSALSDKATFTLNCVPRGSAKKAEKAKK